MKGLFKNAVAGAAAIFAVAAFAATGESWKSSDSLTKGKTKTVTLVAEKNLYWESGDDPDAKYDDNGAYYAKITCKRGTTYSVWTSGLPKDSNVNVSVDPLGWYDEKDDHNYFSGFEDISFECKYHGPDCYYVLRDWDSDDPSSCTFVVYISGEIGDKVTIGFKEGIEKPKIQSGTEGNPLALSIGSANSSKSATMIDGAYYFTAKLTAGKMYKFWTSGGTEDVPLGLDVEAAAEEPELCDMSDVDVYNTGRIVIPTTTGAHLIVVDGMDNGRFTLNYGIVAAESPKDPPGSEEQTKGSTEVVSPWDDYLKVYSDDCSFDVGEAVDTSEGAYFEVDSASAVTTVSVAGLPPGVKFDVKTRMFSGAPTKAGLCYVTVSAKNANGFTHSRTAEWNVGDAERPDYDNIQSVSLGEFDELWTGSGFYWEGSGITAISGLPEGLKFESKAGIVWGTPTKAGKYSLTFTDSNRRKAVKTAFVRDSGSCWIEVVAQDVNRGDGFGGTVSGSGVYPAGAKVTFKATPSKGSAFRCWVDWDGEDFASGTTKTCILPAIGNCFVYAQFIYAGDDWLYVSSDDQYFDVGQEVDTSEGAYFGVDSGSAATVSVAGLPPGVKFDAKGRVFTGAPTKAGLYYVTMTAKNANGFANSWTAEWNVGGVERPDFDDIQEYDFSGFYDLYTGNYYEWDLYGIASVSGLPDGLKFDSKTGLVTGTPTKAGKYELTFADQQRRKAVVTTFVRDGGSQYLDVRAYDDSTGEYGTGGTVSGAGVYASGAKVTLKATAAKGYAFRCWSDWNGDDYLSGPAKTFSMPSVGNCTVDAHFIPVRDDWLYVSGDDQYFGVGDEVATDTDAYFGIDSGSYVTAAVSGLPTGVKFDAATRSFSGAPTKKGVYYVAMSAKNANGFASSWTARWTVGDAEDADYDDWGFDFSAFDDVQTGRYFEWSADDSFKISGLPAGMTVKSVSRCCGEPSYTVVSGTPTRAGAYTVSFVYGRQTVAVKTVFVRDGGSIYVDAPVEDMNGSPDERGLGSVSGCGVYATGASVTLKAAAAKGAAFAGWWIDGERVSDAAAYSFVAERDRSMPVARFIAARDDWLWVNGDCYRRDMDAVASGNICCGLVPSIYGSNDEGELFGVDSGSAATVSFSGLPKGVKYDAATGRFTGAPEKAGVYYVTMTAKNANGYAATATQQWVAGGAGTGDYDEIGIDRPGIDSDGSIWMTAGEWLEESWAWSDIKSVTGLPPGVKFRASDITGYGTPTTPGKYTLLFADSEGRKAAHSIVVHDPGMGYVALGVGNGSEGLGTVAGEGAYAAGSRVKISAKAAKGCVFAGWYCEDPGCPEDNRMFQPSWYEADGDDWRSPDCTFTLVAGMTKAYYGSSVHVYAKFIPVSEDYLRVNNEDGEEWRVTSGGVEGGLSVECPTLPTVTAKGLPAGLKFNGPQLAVADETKLKPGYADVVLTIKSATGLTETRTVRIRIDAPELFVVARCWNGEDEPHGTATGGGLYWPGTKVSLKATPDKGAAFVGWFRDGYDLISSDTTISYVTGEGDETVEAHFVAAREDWLRIDFADQDFDVGQEVDTSDGAYFGVDSGSAATVAVSGLPDGVKFDAKARKFSGAPTKAGIYYVTMTAKNANGFTRSAIARWSVGGAAPDDYDHINSDEGWLDAFDGLWTGMDFYWQQEGLVSVSGLPDGLKLDAKTGEVRGIPAKPGKYVLMLGDAQKHTAKKTVLVQDNGSAYVSARFGDGQEGRGTLTGEGVWQYGSTVKLAAKAAKGYVFAGWYEDYDLTAPFIVPGGSDYRKDSLSYPFTDWSQVELFARFVTPAEDTLAFSFENGEIWNVATDYDGDYWGFDVYSATAPTVTAKGLPAGIEMDGFAFVVTDRSKLKPGAVEVTVTAKNLSGISATRTLRIAVPNLVSEHLPNLNPDVDAYHVTAGISVGESSLFDLTTEDGWTLSAISGLPKGLSYGSLTNPDVKGVPTAPGVYTVTVTAKKGRETTSATVTLNVDALPDWACGEFAGIITALDDEGYELHGYATMSVSALGKISAKMTIDGETWTASADSYYLCDGGGAYAYVTAKSGRKWVDGEIRVSSAYVPNGLSGATADFEFWGGYGVSGGANARLCRNIWKDKATAVVAKEELAALAGLYTVNLTDSDGVCGYGYLTATVGSDGTVKTAGKLPDGTSVSSSSLLMYDDGYRAIVFAAPKAYKGGEVFVELRFDKDSRSVSCDGGSWVNLDPAATGTYGEGFRRSFSGFGAYYDEKAKLCDCFVQGAVLSFAINAGNAAVDYSTRKKVTETYAETAYPVGVPATEVTIDAKGTSFAVPKATKPVQDRETGDWIYEGQNDGALTLTLSKGVFKGSYTLWYDYDSAYDETTEKTTRTHTSKKVDFEGVWVQGEPFRGFCLMERTGTYEDPKTGKVKTYKYKESSAVGFE